MSLFTLLAPPELLGQLPVSLVEGDFNNDGVEDLVSLNRWSGDVSALIGLGGGNFQKQIRSPLALYGDNSGGMLAADFDRDGNLDLLAWSSGSTKVLIGLGNGRFRMGANEPWGNSIASVVVGDFNSDNNLDIVVADRGVYSNEPLPPRYAPALIVSFGNGDGSFSPLIRTVMVDSPLALAAGDFNNDGRADLALAYGVVPRCSGICTPSTGGLVLLTGRGDGSFDAGDRLDSEVPCAVAAGDLDSDGHDDLMVLSKGYPQSGFSPFLSSGDGHFVPGDRIDQELSSCSITMSDFNTDGHLDFATPDSVYLGIGDGTFGSQRKLGLYPSFVVAGDFNLDGNSDLAGIFGEDLGFLLGRGDGEFDFRRGSYDRYFGTGDSPSGIAVGDFNADGISDLIVTNSRSNDVSLFQGMRPEIFEFARQLPVGVSPVGVIVADLNEDGMSDVAVLNEGSRNVSILLGEGDGSFYSSKVFDGISPSSLGMAIGDLNGDGHEDLAVTSLYSNDVSILEGGGDGTFRLARRVTAGEAPLGIVAADFDEDGNQDLAVSNSASQSVSLLRGRGNGTFEIPKHFAAGVLPYKLAVGDFNSDGAPDLAVANAFFAHAGTVSILIGGGDGNFKPQQIFAVEGLPTDVIAVDLNEDGIVDVATSDRFGGVSLLRGVGDGTFSTVQFLEGGAGPSGIVAGDFSGDHRLDIAVADAGNNTVSVWVRNSRPVAVVKADEAVECTSSQGTRVLLDGTGSTDPDGTPATNDDIASFEWFEDGSPYGVFLGSGQLLEVSLGLGEHFISLYVTDKAGAVDSISFQIWVLDSTPPALRVSLNPSRLWPPDHRMVEVSASVEASDACGSTTILLDGIVSNEPDGSSDNGNQKDMSDIQGALPGTADFGFQLRAERVANGTGRKYTVTYQALDASSNISSASVVVTVPLSQAEPPKPR
jgi:FG-GAP repeat.